MNTSRSRRLESLAMYLKGAKQALERIPNEIEQSIRTKNWARVANYSKRAKGILSSIWDDDSLYRAFAQSLNAEYVAIPNTGHALLEERASVDSAIESFIQRRLTAIKP